MPKYDSLGIGVVVDRSSSSNSNKSSQTGTRSDNKNVKFADQDKHAEFVKNIFATKST